MLEPQLGMKMNEIIEFAKYAEKSGYGYVLRSDHILPTSGAKGLESSECWVTLGALAASTSKINFGPLVSPVGFRNPALLARMACTLHSFSRGRLVLGLGAGWFEDEFLAHGYEFPPFGVRFAQFREALSIVRPLTEGKRVDFQGKYFTAHTDCLPKPRGKVHLIIGGRPARMVRIAAQFADEWNILSPPLELYRKLRKVFDSHMAGRNVKVSQMGTFLIGESKRELDGNAKRFAKLRGIAGGAEAAIERMKQNGGLCGTLGEFVSQVNERLEAGIERFYLQVLDTGNREMVDLLTRTLKKEF